MVAIGPHPTSLDATAHAIGARPVAGPYACAQTVERVIGDRQRVGLILEGGDRQYGAKDFLLENPHLVMALEDGGRHIIALAQIALMAGAFAAGQHLRAFFATDGDVGQDLFQLVVGRLRADHRRWIERAALLDGLHPRDGPFDEPVVDRFLNERATGAGADFALVQREHGKAFQAFVEIIVVRVHHVGKEDVGRLAAQFQRHRDQVFRRILHDQAAGRGFAGKGDLADPLAAGERLARFDAKAIDDVEHARRQQVADNLRQHQDRHRGLFGRLEHDAIAGRQRRRQFPHRHQDGEVPRNDLAHHAQRFVEMIGDGVMVDLADRAFLGTGATGEIAEMVDRQRNIGMGRLADRLAVVDRLGHRDQIQIGFHPVGDLQQDVGPFGR